MAMTIWTRIESKGSPHRLTHKSQRPTPQNPPDRTRREKPRACAMGALHQGDLMTPGVPPGSIESRLTRAAVRFSLRTRGKGEPRMEFALFYEISVAERFTPRKEQKVYPDVLTPRRFLTKRWDSTAFGTWNSLSWKSSHTAPTRKFSAMPSLREPVAYASAMAGGSYPSLTGTPTRPYGQQPRPTHRNCPSLKSRRLRTAPLSPQTRTT